MLGGSGGVAGVGEQLGADPDPAEGVGFGIVLDQHEVLDRKFTVLLDRLTEQLSCLDLGLVRIDEIVGSKIPELVNHGG